MKKTGKLMKMTATAAAMTLLLTSCGGGTFMEVNGEKISKKQYDDQLDLYKSLVAYQQQLPASIENSLIQEAVITKDLKDHDVKITDEEYKEDYDKEVENYGGAEGYRNFLTTVGISDDQMKDTFRFQTRVRKHREMFNQQNPPSDEEMKKYYEEHKDELMTIDANHIIVATEEEAKKAKERIDGGEKFEDVAKDVSTDGTAAAGGALGAKSPTTYDPAFAKALKELKEGEVSDPVQSSFGWHIIRVNKVNDSFDDLKDQIANTLNSQAYMTYVQDLVKKAEVTKPGQTKASEESKSESSSAADEQKDDKKDDQQDDKKDDQQEEKKDDQSAAASSEEKESKQ